METPVLADRIEWDEGAWWTLLAANNTSRVRLEGLGPGGIRSAWNQGAKLEQGR